LFCGDASPFRIHAAAMPTASGANRIEDLAGGTAVAAKTDQHNAVRLHLEGRLRSRPEACRQSMRGAKANSNAHASEIARRRRVQRQCPAEESVPTRACRTHARYAARSSA